MPRPPPPPPPSPPKRQPSSVFAGLAAYMLPSIHAPLRTVVFEGYYFAANQSASVASCMCMDGRRVRAVGAPLDPSIDFQQRAPTSRQCWWTAQLFKYAAVSTHSVLQSGLSLVSLAGRLTLTAPPLPVRCSRRPPHVPRLLGQHDLVPGEQRVLDSNWRGPCAVTCVALLADHPRPVTPSGPILSPDPVLPMLTQPLPSRSLQAAPFVAACRLDALAGGVCAASCATRLAPFNSDCFHSVLAEDYFQYAPDQQAPDATITAAFYDACFPPAGAQLAAPAADASQQQKAPALSAAGAGMGAASSSAQAGSGVWGLVAALAAAALLAA